MSAPITQSLLDELNQLRSHTLNYPCEVRLTALCKQLEERCATYRTVIEDGKRAMDLLVNRAIWRDECQPEDLQRQFNAALKLPPLIP